jgi:AcrR family transcriptional regulator
MPGRRELRKQRTRSGLLKAAMTLFRDRGLQATRIADITDLADVGKGVFYNYFPTKEALVAELVRDALESLEREFLMTLDSALTLEQRVEQLALLHEKFFEQHPDYALLIHQGRGLLLLGGSPNQPLHDAFRDYLTRLSRWLPPPAERPAWKHEDLLEAAAAVAGAVAGYRSFRSAAGLDGTSTVGRVLSAGVPRLLEARRLSAVPPAGKGA